MRIAAFDRLSRRTLRDEAPGAQVTPDRRGSEADANLTRDQHANRVTRPQRKGQLQLVRVAVCDHPPEPLLLLPGRRLLFARPAATPTAGERRCARATHRLDPLADEA
jgi:hypothetical protein